ncbi:hypothetical protein HN789_02195 [archaeon]|jgi:hypothetical protein|nr:hypothetical protein [archaeon]MBT4021868.1 hypothetical protein [archaeon]MBT4272163.1 hypothetical protein [archaeon]MBT4460344.1 hypothetical protein [archaeon]MBT4858968.1 hypothetical protein [archaeon]
MKEFLKPNWKKFLLPIFLIVCFFVLVKYYFYYAIIVDEHTPTLINFIDEIEEYRKLNDSRSMNKTGKNIENYVTQNKIKEKFSKLQDIEFLAVFLPMINPFMPQPCEFRFSTFCKYYIDETTYNLIESRGSFAGASLFDYEKKEYVQISYFDIFFNTIILFAEGYLFSCLVIHILHFFKKPRNNV